MVNRLGIIVVGYKNTVGINRLFSSLDKVEYSDDDVTLIISIDYSGDLSVKELAENYRWEHGAKIVKAYESNLGLRTHILKCGDYIEEFDLDAVAVLEDDIYVAPNMYSYMRESVAFYGNDLNIAGISLYKHEFNIYAKRPFQELKDGGDTFFMQYAQSWGQIWLRKQWSEFRAWYNAKQWESIDQDMVPDNVLDWKNSWLKFHIMYCIDQKKYFVYPRISLTTDFSDAGTHCVSNTTSMQVAFDMSSNKDWKFNTIESTNAIYDCFFENQRLGAFLKEPSVEIDLYGTKKKIYTKNKLLTNRLLPYRVEKSFGLSLRPHEANILFDIAGFDYYLYNLNDKDRIPNDKNKNVRIFEYDNKGIRVLQFASIAYIARQLKVALMQRIRKINRRMKKD